MDNEILIVNGVQETFNTKIPTNNNNEFITYFDLLTKIKNKEIIPNDYIFIDEYNIDWIWSEDIEGLQHIDKNGGIMYDDYIIFIDDKYNDLDLVDLQFKTIEKKTKQNNVKHIATQNIIKMLEKCYMDLSMEMDSCQGCMNDLNIAFEELKIYESLVEFLGGSIKNHFQELVEQWHKNSKKQEQNKKEEQAKKDAIIKSLPFPILDLMHIDDKIRDVLLKQNNKINEICKILQNNKFNYKK